MQLTATTIRPPTRLPNRLLNLWRKPSSTTPHGVQIVEGSQPRYNDELNQLLRKRLRAITLVLGIEKIVLLVGTLMFPLLEMRIAAIAVMFLCHLHLRSKARISTSMLRWIELLILFVFIIQAVFMPDALILLSVRSSDYVTATMDHHWVIGAWAVFAVVYGLLVPNTWWRAVVIIVLFCLAPELNFYLLQKYEPLVEKAFNSIHHGPPVPLMLLACFAGIYGAHTIQTIRTGTFRARRLGRYRLREKLGTGGMGEVYRAQHDLLKRPCAIKIIRPDLDTDLAIVTRFEREVQATAQLSHRNTIRIYDYGRTEEGGFYYVMELLSGMSLQDLVTRNGPVHYDQAMHIMRQVAGALVEAHGLGLIHRDIKPANIFLTTQGGHDNVAKLLDFGLVKTNAKSPGNLGSNPSPAESVDLDTTREHITFGSPLYMSPEQVTGATEVDARSDVYSLGAVGYFLVTGRPPFDGKTTIDVVAALTRDLPVPPSTVNPAISPGFERIIMRCLQKKPEARFPDMETLLLALDSRGACDPTVV